MRTVVGLTLLVLCGADTADAAGAQLPAASALQQLSESGQSKFVRYDTDGLTATLELSFARGRLAFSIANALELPEYEPPGGVYFDEATLLTEELNGFEVETGGERMFSLMLRFDW